MEIDYLKLATITFVIYLTATPLRAATLTEIAHPTKQQSELTEGTNNTDVNLLLRSSGNNTDDNLLLRSSGNNTDDNLLLRSSGNKTDDNLLLRSSGNQTDSKKWDVPLENPDSCLFIDSDDSGCHECADALGGRWPSTTANSVMQSPCPRINNIDTGEGYANRKCLANGTWEKRIDFLDCISFLEGEIEQYNKTRKVTLSWYITTASVYYTGFAISNIAMITAIIIFIRFRHLRCLRNLIHSQLMIAMTIKNFLWMVLLHNAVMDPNFFKKQFSWMFVEGLYLFLVVVRALLTDSFKFKHYLLIGWGIPVVTSIAWIVSNVAHAPIEQKKDCWIAFNTGNSPSDNVDIVAISTLLAINAIFMITIVWTLVQKLKDSSMTEYKQYRKVVKATVVLVVLLGGTYGLWYSTSTSEEQLLDNIWMCINAAIQSTQGFIVALVYCFMNGEVKASIVKCHRRWKDSKTLPSSSDNWLSRRRRSSSALTKRDETETDYMNYSRRSSRRVSNDTTPGSRRGSNNDGMDLNANKVRRLLAIAQPLVEERMNQTGGKDRLKVPPIPV